MSTPRYRTAIHEAGHVIVAWALGLDVGVVQITDVGGTTLLARLSPLPTPLADVVWLLSGPSAEVIAFGAAGERGARSDRVNAERSAYEITGPLTRDLDAGAAMAVLDELLARALVIVVDELMPSRWSLVEKVASRLLAHPLGRLLVDDLGLERPKPFHLSDLLPWVVPERSWAAEGAAGVALPAALSASGSKCAAEGSFGLGSASVVGSPPSPSVIPSASLVPA